MSESRTEHVLNDIDKRLTLVESELSRMAGTRKLILGTLGFLFLQAVAGAVGYGQLINTVTSLSQNTDTRLIEQNIATALRVAQEHGNEIELVRRSVERVSGSIEQLWGEQTKIRDVIAESTKSRFYREDALPIYDRIKQLENRVARNESYIFAPKDQ